MDFAASFLGATGATAFFERGVRLLLEAACFAEARGVLAERPCFADGLAGAFFLPAVFVRAGFVRAAMSEDLVDVWRCGLKARARDARRPRPSGGEAHEQSRACPANASRGS
ncbi:MAG: hypothetical protein ACREF4_10240 [Gammaproteobacteria bacterium]